MDGESTPESSAVPEDIGTAATLEPAPAALRAPDELAQFVAAMAQGEQAALGSLYDRAGRYVYAVCRRMLNDDADAEEATLDVFMKAWRNAAAYDPSRAAVLSWLILMARSVSLDRLRMRQVRPRFADPPEGLAEPAETSASPLDLTAEGQVAARVRRAWQQLRDEQRLAVGLAFFEGLSHAEIAARLDQPLGTVKTRVRLGLRHLRGLLEEMA